MNKNANWLKIMIEDPRGGLGRLRAGWDRRQDRNRWRRIGIAPQEFYKASPVAEQQLHELLGVPWPCPEHAACQAIIQQLKREFGFSEGFGTKSGTSALKFFDADVTVSRMAWCVTRHLTPARIIETGVARGVTSRFLLEAIQRNGVGGLWSIDLPHSDTYQQIGSAVPEKLRKPWVLLFGSSQRHLPKLLNAFDEIDVFVHDSLHTSRNVRFELDCAWERLRPGGVILLDDVNENLGFHSFVQAVRAKAWVVGRKEILAGLWGAIIK